VAAPGATSNQYWFGSFPHTSQMKDRHIVIGDPAEELRAIQLIGLALLDAAGRMNHERPQECRRMVVPPILMAAAHSLFLAGAAGLETPIQIVALAVRNTFELWLRFKHVTSSDDNCQRWRNENITDQIQIYEGMLKLPGPANSKNLIREEIQRISKVATERGLKPGGGLAQPGDLARELGELEDYAAFYKLYSKLVHPSSWSVNSPTAVETPMYRQTLVANAQIYGWRLLRAVEDQFGVLADQSYDAALAKVGKLPDNKIH
jgi:hypothetical protein